MRPAQSFAQEDRGADGADDGDGRGGNDRAVGQRREAVAAGLQQSKRRAAQRGQETGALEADAGQGRQAPAHQQGQHDRAGDQEARKDHVRDGETAHDSGARRGERQRGAERHDASRQESPALAPCPLRLGRLRHGSVGSTFGANPGTIL
jgi:hypothetical protein